MQIPYRKPGKYSQMIPDPLMTKDKLSEIREKLDRLKHKQPQAIEDVTRLAQLGDFSENAEYQLAKGRLRGINNAILRLENQLHQAVIIPKRTQNNTVQIGHQVTVENGGKKKAYQILGSTQTDPKKGIISYNSPLGEALIGKRVNELAFVRLAGKIVKYKIIDIK